MVVDGGSLIGEWLELLDVILPCSLIMAEMSLVVFSGLLLGDFKTTSIKITSELFSVKLATPLDGSFLFDNNSWRWSVIVGGSGIFPSKFGRLFLEGTWTFAGGNFCLRLG